MPNTTYTFDVPLNGLKRNLGQRIADLFAHLDAFNLTIVGFSIQGQNLRITLNNPIPAEQLEHLGLS